MAMFLLPKIRSTQRITSLYHNQRRSLGLGGVPNPGFLYVSPYFAKETHV